MVNCVFLKREAPGLDRQPYPGELGKRIFDNVSKEAWQQWVKHQGMLINEDRRTPIEQTSPTGVPLFSHYVEGLTADAAVSITADDRGHPREPNLCARGMPPNPRGAGAGRSKNPYRFGDSRASRAVRRMPGRRAAMAFSCMWLDSPNHPDR